MRTFTCDSLGNALERSRSAGPPVGRAAAPGTSGAACCPAAPRGPRCGPAVLACWNPPRARARAIWTSTEEQPPKYLVPILAAGAVAAVLLPDATGCMGKKKKKDTDEADDMYEVDFIDLAKMARQTASTLGAPHHLRGWSVSFPRQASSMAMTKGPGLQLP